MEEYHPSSYRDPHGRVFCIDRRVFRSVTELGRADFDEVVSSGILHELTNSGDLIGWSMITSPGGGGGGGQLEGHTPEDAVYVIEHPRLDIISYPFEWSFTQLQTAAIHYLNVLIAALEKNITLIDASAFNVQFVGARPVFIDLLSFRPYQPTQMWHAHHQFCEHFFNPLLLTQKFGIGHSEWFRGNLEGIPTSEIARLLGPGNWLRPSVLTNVLLPNLVDTHAAKNQSAKPAGPRKIKNKEMSRETVIGLVKKNRDWVAAMTYRASNRSTWRTYDTHNTYNFEETKAKERLVQKFIRATQPGIVLDIGCNTGHYSEIALSAGAGFVVGLEGDRDAHEAASRRAQLEKLNFLPLNIDLTNPSPSLGWRLKERMSLDERISADASLSLAIIHHLIFRHNIPMDDAISYLVGLAPTGLIEFVPREDPMAVKLIGARHHLFEHYDLENFRHQLNRHARIVHEEQITDMGRCLFQFDRT